MKVSKRELKNTKVSIGIPAYNEEKDIIKILCAIINQKLENSLKISEIIVVNDASSDKTKTLVEKFIKKNNLIKIFSQPKRKGKPAAINYILNKTKEDLVIIANADNIPHSNCLQYLLNKAVDKKVALVGPQIVSINADDNFVGYANSLIWRLHHRIALKDPKTGGFVLIKKKAITFLPEESPVDESTLEAMVGENGYQVVYEPQAILYLKGPKKFGDYFSQRRRIHVGYLWLKKKYPKYRPSTFGFYNLITALSRELSFDIVENLYLIAIIIIEITAAILAKFDFYAKNKDHQIWQIAASSKNLNVNEKP